MTDEDLVAALLTRCGMLMEDVSVIALLRADSTTVADQIVAVQEAAGEITTLVTAAAMLLGQDE